jgi:hypothetical protein
VIGGLERRNSDHALDLPIDEWLPYGPHGRMGSMPETTPLPPFLSLTHFLDGQTVVNALPRDALRAGVHLRCPSAPPARSR